MEGPALVLREVTREEIAAVHALWAESGLPFHVGGRDDPALLAAGMRAARTNLVGAFSGGDLIGAVLVTDDSRKGWINRLAVKPAFRRRGVALALLRAAERLLGERGLGLAAALVEEGNDASLALFAEAGYEARRDIVYLRRFLMPGW